MMRKTRILLFLILVSGTCLFGLDTLGLRFTGFSGQNFTAMEYKNQNGRLELEDFVFYDLSPRNIGGSMEIYTDHFGIGTSASILGLGEGEGWNSEYDLRSYLTYHLRGTDRALDIFGEAGLGFAGLMGAPLYHTEKAYQFDVDYGSPDWNSGTFYPHLAVGMAFRPHAGPFTIGAKLSYRYDVDHFADLGSFSGHSTRPFDLAIFAGVSLNLDLARYRRKVRQVTDWFRQVEHDREAIHHLKEDMKELRDRFDEYTSEEDDTDFDFHFEDLSDNQGQESAEETSEAVQARNPAPAEEVVESEPAEAETAAVDTEKSENPEDDQAPESGVDWDALKEKIEELIQEEIKEETAEQIVDDDFLDDVREDALEAVGAAETEESNDSGDEINIRIDIQQN